MNDVDSVHYEWTYHEHGAGQPQERFIRLALMHHSIPMILNTGKCCSKDNPLEENYYEKGFTFYYMTSSKFYI